MVEIKAECSDCGRDLTNENAYCEVCFKSLLETIQILEDKVAELSAELSESKQQ